MKVYSDNIDNSKVEIPHDKFDLILKYSKLSFILMVGLSIAFSILASFFGFFIFELYDHLETVKQTTDSVELLQLLK
jgi:hypothetical protein